MADLRTAFLDAILADPDDDVCRLVFADWLDDHGEADRAEFIRLQIDLARPVVPEEAKRLRAEELLARHRADWLPGCDGIDWMVVFRRGFAEVVEVPAGGADVFASRAARLFALAPIVEVTIDPPPTFWPTLLAFPELRRLRCLRAPHIDRAGLALLIASPHLTGLRWLDLNHGRIAAGGLELLLDSSLHRQLTALSLGGNRTVEQYDWDGVDWTDATLENVGEQGVVDLAASAQVAGLRRLDLTWNHLGPRAVEALVASRNLGGLRELRVAERGTVAHDGNADTEREEPSPLSDANLAALRTRFGEVLRLWPDW